MTETTAAADAFQSVVPAEVPGGIYHFLTGVVAPRPISWVSSVGPDGVLNLAPHSYFVVLSHNPPMLGVVSVGLKHTVQNVAARGEYVINVAGEELAKEINLTAADFPPEEDEFAWAGLTPVPSAVVPTPSVGEAAVSFEMRLIEVKPTGDCFLIIGEVVHVRYADRIVRDGRVAPDLIRLIGRMAGSTYSRTTDRFDLRRPKYVELVEAGVKPRTPSRNRSSEPSARGMTSN